MNSVCLLLTILCITFLGGCGSGGGNSGNTPLPQDGSVPLINVGGDSRELYVNPLGQDPSMASEAVTAPIGSTVEVIFVVGNGYGGATASNISAPLILGGSTRSHTLSTSPTYQWGNGQAGSLPSVVVTINTVSDSRLVPSSQAPKITPPTGGSASSLEFSIPSLAAEQIVTEVVYYQVVSA